MSDSIYGEGTDDIFEQTAWILRTADEVLAVRKIPVSNLFSGLAAGTVTQLAVKAARESRFTPAVDELGNTMEIAKICDRGHSAEPFSATGEVQMVRGADGFRGLTVDLSQHDEGTYHLNPDGKFLVEENGQWEPLGKIRSRLLDGKMRRYTLIDPRLLE